jgi:hypothetical protein
MWWSPRWLQPLWRAVLVPPGRGARAAIYAASAPELEGITGLCFRSVGRRQQTSRRSRDLAARRKLWEMSADLTKFV